MQINGTRFSTIEFDDEDIVTFEDGIIGFTECQRFVLVNNKPDGPFRWLQSIDQPALAFLVVDPAEYKSDYAPDMTEDVAQDLGLTEETPRMVFTTVAIPPGNPQGMTINLTAPIIINAVTKAAAQVVLEDAAYTMKHRVFQEANRVSEDAAA